LQRNLKDCRLLYFILFLSKSFDVSTFSNFSSEIFLHYVRLTLVWNTSPWYNFLTVADPIKLFFFANEEYLRFFDAKVGHFIVNDYFLYVTKQSN